MAGVAALMYDANPDLTPAQVKDGIVSTGGGLALLGALMLGLAVRRR